MQPTGEKSMFHTINFLLCNYKSLEGKDNQQLKTQKEYITLRLNKKLKLLLYASTTIKTFLQCAREIRKLRGERRPYTAAF